MINIILLKMYFGFIGLNRRDIKAKLVEIIKK